MRDFPIHTGLAIALFGAVLGGAHLLTPAPAKVPPKAPVTTVAQPCCELWFLRDREGGVVALTADGVELGEIDTAGEKGPGFAAFESKEPAHTLELRVTQGHARIFGVSAERGLTGVVYDSL